VDKLNHEAYNMAWSHLHAAIDNVMKGARYHRVDPSGDRAIKCAKHHPFVQPYFTGPSKEDTYDLAAIEKLIWSPDQGTIFRAHNGTEYFSFFP
jgi:hypothetical protein